MIDDLETLTRDRPRVAIELSEHMLTRLDQVDLDDSDGWLTQFCERLTVIHAEAGASSDLPAEEVASRRTRLQSLALRPFDGLVDLD